ncbi:MAG: hypothetical protein AB7T86_03160 [Xanthobacteraceae bacterium]|uniref:hypothetical protein n=1 Tax=Pseudolabrys sp. TaxID=1960880 RepID=UPI003D0FCF4B
MSNLSFVERLAEILRHVPALFGIGRDSAPIESVAGLQAFVASRSAFMAQKTLYGYVKTRMGTRHVAMFDDPAMIASLNIARHNIFAACLSDLTIYAVGVSLHDEPAGNDVRIALARRIYDASIAGMNGAPAEFNAAEAAAAFAERAAATEWRAAARQPEIFAASPAALYRWAPIADQLKRLDREIVENSVIFAWRDIREQFNKRLVPAAIVADWSAQRAN